MKLMISKVAAALVLGAFASSVGCTAASSGNETPSGPVELPEQEKISPPSGANGSPGGSTSPAPGGNGETSPVMDQYKLPAWMREDVQPKSTRFNQSYGLDAYNGKTIVVVLLEGHCPYCQSNSVVAQKLQDDFVAEKLDIQIVVLGDLNATQFAGKVALPIFRDHDGKAWDEMRPNASKHDTFVFGPDGKRTFFWLGSYQGDATRWRAEVGAAAREVAKPISQSL